MPQWVYRLGVSGRGGVPSASGTVRRTMERPQWWAVLAVALALMAMIAAVSSARQVVTSTRGSTSGMAPSDGGRTNVGESSRSRHVASASTQISSGMRASSTDSGPPESGTGLASANAQTGPTRDSTSQPIDSGTATGNTNVPTSVPSSPTSVAAVSPTAQAPVSGVGASSDPQATQGYLQYPDNATATYQAVMSGGSEGALVDWATTDQLKLLVTCPSDSQTASGPSPLHVHVTATAGLCTITLSETSTATAPIPYTLTLEQGPS